MKKFLIPTKDILSRLAEISNAINKQPDGDLAHLENTMCLIVDSIQEIIPDSSAMIYTYDVAHSSFDPTSRFASSEDTPPESDEPRPEGLGAKAILKRQQVFSYDQAETGIHPVKAAQGFKTVTCYPLLDADHVLGVFYVFLRREAQFKEKELSVIRNFVNLTTMNLAATNRVNLAEQEKIRKDKELRMLRKAGMLISSRNSLKGTLDAILKMALEITDAKYGIFRLIDKESQNLVTATFISEQPSQPAIESLPIDDQSITGLVALSREPLFIPDLSAQPWNKIYYPFDRELVMHSELVVPLIGASGRLEGVLNLESPMVNGFSKQDRYILQILATQAVAAIQEIRLLDMLQEITTLLLTQPLQATLQTLVEKACDLLNTPFSLIWLKENDKLSIRAATEPQLMGHKVSFEDSFTGQALYGAEAVVSDQACRDIPDDLPNSNVYGQALIVPLYSLGESEGSAGQPAGALSVYSEAGSERDFDQAEWDVKVLNILGYYVTMAIQNAARQEAVRVAQEQRTVTEAFAAVGDIASNLLHQLNNKIGTIPVRIEGIQDKCQKALSEDTYLNSNLLEIEHSATETMSVVRDSLFHLRPIQFTSVDINTALTDAISNLQIPSQVRINTKGLENLPRVHACSKRLPLVFSNLLDNALRVLQGEGEIRIEGKTFEDSVEIRITDSGPGISAELHERIFEINYSERSSGGQNGLGFGLWWVKTLMARFGGAVTVESDGFSWTSFILSLPLEKDC